MKKKIIAIFMLFLTMAMIYISIPLIDVYADNTNNTNDEQDSNFAENEDNDDNIDIGMDIGGESTGYDGKDYGEGKSDGYSIRLSTMLKVSLVNVSGNYPEAVDYRYYVYINKKNNSGLYYDYFDNTSSNSWFEYNYRGYKYVCSEKRNENNCESIEEKEIITEDDWFLERYGWGTNISARKISNKFNEKEFFINMLNELNIQSVLEGKKIEKFENLTNKDLKKLTNYRIIVEPVYIFSDHKDQGKENQKVPMTYATIKGMANIMIREGRTSEGLGISLSKFATNMYATATHGSINANGKLNTNDIVNKLNSASGDYYEYYKTLADVNSGYGYGIFYIIGGCDPDKSCCYDEKGIYHQEYYGTIKNYQCENGIVGKNCQSAPKLCVVEEKNPPKKLSCDNNDKITEFSEVISKDDVKTDRIINTWDEDYLEHVSNKEKGECSNELSQTIIGDVEISQKGEIYIGLPNFDSPIYSGGGFRFDAQYKGEASYELVGNLTYTISQKYEYDYCPRPPLREKVEEGVTYTYGTPVLNNGKCIYPETKKYKSHDCGNDADGKPIASCEKTETGEYIGEAEKGCKEDTEPYECDMNSMDNLGIGCKNALQAFAKEMSDEYLKTYHNFTTSLSAQTLFGDSNDEKKYAQLSNKGNWEVVQYNHQSVWKPTANNTVSYVLEYKQQKACINTKTAEVDYISQDDDCGDSYIDGGVKYYIPLKLQDDVAKGYDFPVKFNINEVSMIKGMAWSLEYECGVNCNQKLYNKKGNIDLIYRPIDMSNPFPNIVNENRQIGINWQTFMNDKTAYNNKMNRNEENIEYSVTLNPNDIAKIKGYNNGKNYINLNTMDNDGFSNFLKEYGINNKKNNNYNPLGLCFNECWTTY